MARSVTSAPKESEDDLAKAVADYLRLAWPTELPWWHTPNGGSRAQVERQDRRSGRTYRFSPEAAKLKKMGVLAGVPDLTFILPNGQVAFIELKVADGTLSDEQADLRKLLLDCHCGYAIARSVEDVERITTDWLAAYDLKPRATLLGRQLP